MPKSGRRPPVGFAALLLWTIAVILIRHLKDFAPWSWQWIGLGAIAILGFSFGFALLAAAFLSL